MFGWGITGEASAEHGSALPLGHYRRSPCRAWPGTTAGALPVKPLPSIARHYASAPPLFAQRRGGLGRGERHIAPMDLPSERRRNAATICSTP